MTISNFAQALATFALKATKTLLQIILLILKQLHQVFKKHLFRRAFSHSSIRSYSWLVRSTPERTVRVRALAGNIVLCSWARHFTLTVPLSTQVYKWVPANLMLGGNPAMD